MKYIFRCLFVAITLIACTKKKDVTSMPISINPTGKYKGTISTLQSATDGTTTIEFNANKSIEIVGEIKVSGNVQRLWEGTWDSKDNQFNAGFTVNYIGGQYLFHLNGVINKDKIEGTVIIQYENSLPSSGVFSLVKITNP